MNPGQEQFYNFFIERTMDDKKEEAKELLMEGFAKQAEGTFDRQYFEEVKPKYFALIKSECIEEVKAAMEHFSSRL